MIPDLRVDCGMRGFGGIPRQFRDVVVRVALEADTTVAQIG